MASSPRFGSIDSPSSPLGRFDLVFDSFLSDYNDEAVHGDMEWLSDGNNVGVNPISSLSLPPSAMAASNHDLTLQESVKGNTRGPFEQKQSSSAQTLSNFEVLQRGRRISGHHSEAGIPENAASATTAVAHNDSTTPNPRMVSIPKNKSWGSSSVTHSTSSARRSRSNPSSSRSKKGRGGTKRKRSPISQKKNSAAWRRRMTEGNNLAKTLGRPFATKAQKLLYLFWSRQCDKKDLSSYVNTAGF